MVGHFTDARRRPRVPGRREARRARRARHVVPRPLPAHEGQAAGARPPGVRVDRRVRRTAPRSSTRRTAPTTARTTSGTPTPDSPAMRGADPAIILVPGVGMFSYGSDKQTARIAGEFYVNAINVMRGAESVSTYAPIPEDEKFRIEYWALEEAKLQRRPAAEAPRRAHRARDGRGERHRPRDRDPARRRRRLCGRRRPRRRRGAGASPPSSAPPTSPSASAVDVTDAAQVRRGRRRRAAGVRRHRSRREQRRPLDLEAARSTRPRTTGTSSTT